MPTRIVNFDLESALPERVELGSYPRAWVIGWRRGRPVGARLLEPEPGADFLSREALQAALSRDEPPEPASCDPGPLPAVSVIVCTRDRPEQLPIALEALARQTVPFELVIVDNAPRDDRTRRVVAESAPRAVYVEEPVGGLPRARNAGIRAASGTVLAFTDDDCRPAAGWVESIARDFATDSALGCVTGPILPLELETEAQEAMEARGGFNRGFRFHRFEPGVEDGPVYPVQAWRFGAGGSMALSRDCLERIDGFDEALWRSEDIDVFYRALRAGYALAFDPGAAVRHRHLRAWEQLRRRMFHWGWGYLVFLDKIIRTDAPEYAERARTERRNWWAYQLHDRLLPALHGAADLPLSLVARELAGGAVGCRGYPLARAKAAHSSSSAPSAIAS